jgi:hypothetical protein
MYAVHDAVLRTPNCKRSMAMAMRTYDNKRVVEVLHIKKKLEKE